MGTTIMIADDEASLRKLMEATLRDAPRYRVVASDGAKALEVARREEPSLVFLDVRMPGMTGLEVCHALKSDPATRHIMVVMVTALGTDSDRLRAMEAGADNYLVKPFSPTELLGKLEEVLGQPQPPQGGLQRRWLGRLRGSRRCPP